MKKLMITVLMTVLAVSSCNGQKPSLSLNGDAQQLKAYATASDDYVLKNIFKEISKSAEEKWSGNYKMTINYINENSTAFLTVVGAPNTSSEMVILVGAMKRWGVQFGYDEIISIKNVEWHKVLSTYQKQVASFNL